MAENTRKDVPVTRGRGVTRAPARALTPFEDIDRLFEEFLGRGWLRPFRWERAFPAELPFEGRVPRVDVIDRDEEVVVRAEMPGVKKEDVEITIDGDLITLKGEVKREEKEEKGDYYRSEMAYGAFSRTLPLPAAVDESKAKATLADGILEVTLPKVEKSRKRTIKVS
ncbi:MAG: Hsp20/alpha crystallin family protein [Pseudomonadota bacterium]